jgi:hypothetical protein
VSSTGIDPLNGQVLRGWPMSSTVEEMPDADQSAVLVAEQTPPADDPGGLEVTGRVRPGERWYVLLGRWIFVRPIELASLIVIFAVFAAIPFLQLAVLGYFIEASGRLARGGRWRDALPQLPSFSRVGLGLLAILLAALPVRLLSYYAHAGELIEPGNPRSVGYRIAAVAAVFAALTWLLWAWSRGGRLRDYLWPAPLRFLKTAWRPSTWRAAEQRWWNGLVELRLPQRMWLGFRCVAGTLLWLFVPAALLIGAMRNGTTGLAGLIGVIGLLLLFVVLLYLPLLQAEFARTERLRSMFAVRTVRCYFRRAPFACWLGLAVTLLAAVPLYLLKIEATPAEAAWLPSLFFVALMLPAHLVAGWAVGRGVRKPDPRGFWQWLLRWTMRLLSPPLVLFYMLVLYAAQFTAWEGLAVWLQQHAFLLPVPPMLP